jgi:tRNA threonylcarbamoyladenosine biosynthesis protein TsaB
MSHTPFILAIDTSTPVASVAITHGTMVDGCVLASFSWRGAVSHSSRLLTVIETVMTEARMTFPQLAGLAVGLGPGSFTGLRIAMATVKGLAMATGLPLYGVSSLDCLAAAVVGERQVCAALDARKKEIYAGRYCLTPGEPPRRLAAIVAINPETIADWLDAPCLFVGDAVPIYDQLWRRQLGERYQAAPVFYHHPSADVLGLLAGDSHRMRASLPLATAAPMYVRASDAELNLEQATGSMRPLSRIS